MDARSQTHAAVKSCSHTSSAHHTEGADRSERKLHLQLAGGKLVEGVKAGRLGTRLSTGVARSQLSCRGLTQLPGQLARWLWVLDGYIPRPQSHAEPTDPGIIVQPELEGAAGYGLRPGCSSLSTLWQCQLGAACC